MERRRTSYGPTGHPGASLTRGAAGSSLVELLISLVFLGLVMAIAYSFARASFQSVRLQEAQSEAQEVALLALDLLVREVRMAGFSAAGARLTAVSAASRERVEVMTDLDGDGASDGPNEVIAYGYNAEKRELVRATGGASPQPLARDVPPGGVSFAFFDASGTALPEGDGSMALADRQRIHRIDVVLQTEIPGRPGDTATTVTTVSASICLRNQ